MNSIERHRCLPLANRRIIGQLHIDTNLSFESHPRARGWCSCGVDTANREKPSGFVAYLAGGQIEEPAISSDRAIALAKASGVDTKGFAFKGVEFAYAGDNDPVGAGPYSSNSWHWVLHYQGPDRGGCWDLLFVRVGVVHGNVSPTPGTVCE